MRKIITLAALASIVLPMVGSADVLFSDSYDRAANDDIDAVITGIGGTVGSSLTAGNVYSEPNDVSNADPAATVVNGTQLSLANVLTSHAIIQHNFAGDSQITTDGGMRLSFDLDNITSGNKNKTDRYVGMGVANTANEAGDRYLKLNSQFWFGATLEGQVWVYTNGTELAATDLGVNGILDGSKLEAELSFDSFAAGSTVGYNIFVTDADLSGGARTSVLTGSFDWTDDSLAYVGVGSRASDFGIADNLLIETIPEPATLGLIALSGLGVLFVRRILSL